MSVQRSPGSTGMGAPGSRSARSHARGSAGNPDPIIGASCARTDRLRLVLRTTQRPATRSVLASAPTAATLSSRPRSAAPTSRSRFQTSTTAASSRSRRRRSTSTERGRSGCVTSRASGVATHPPSRAVSMTSDWRRACSMSRGRFEPGCFSMNATSCSPMPAVTVDHVSRPARAPRPNSSSEIRCCETPHRAATARWLRNAERRASRSATPSRAATTAARCRPADPAGYRGRLTDPTRTHPAAGWGVAGHGDPWGDPRRRRSTRDHRRRYRGAAADVPTAGGGGSGCRPTVVARAAGNRFTAPGGGSASGSGHGRRYPPFHRPRRWIRLGLRPRTPLPTVSPPPAVDPPPMPDADAAGHRFTAPGGGSGSGSGRIDRGSSLSTPRGSDRSPTG